MVDAVRLVAVDPGVLEERDGPEALVDAERDAVVGPPRAAAARILVVGQQVDAPVGEGLQFARVVVGRRRRGPVAATAPVVVPPRRGRVLPAAGPVLVVAELEHRARIAVHAERLHEAHLVACVAGTVGVGFVARVRAHLLAPGDVAARDVARRVAQDGVVAGLVVHAVELHRAERDAGGVRGVGRLEELEDDIEAVRGRTGPGSSVVGADVLVEDHRLLQARPAAGERNADRLDVDLREDAARERLPRREAGVEAVAAVHALVEQRDRARDVLGVLRHQQVHRVRLESLVLAELPGEIAGAGGRVRHRAAGAAEDVRRVGRPRGILVHLVRRVGGADHFVDEREVAVGFKPGEDVRACGKGEEEEEEMEFLHGVHSHGAGASGLQTRPRKRTRPVRVSRMRKRNGLSATKGRGGGRGGVSTGRWRWRGRRRF